MRLLRVPRGPAYSRAMGSFPCLRKSPLRASPSRDWTVRSCNDAEQAQLAVDSRGKVAGDGDGAGAAVPGGGVRRVSRRPAAIARSRRGCQSQALRSPMRWRSHAPRARISPAALLRGYASATERPKGRQCAKAARAPMRAGATSAP